MEQDENLEIEFLLFSFDLVVDLRVISEVESFEKIKQITYLEIDKETISNLFDLQ